MRSDEIAVLNGPNLPPGENDPPGGGGGGSVSTPWGTFGTTGGVPSGFSDFKSLAQSALTAAAGETGQKRALLQSAANVALAAVPIPVAGWIVALGSVIVGSILSFLGIRGTTQHVSEQKSNEESLKFEATQLQLFNALPTDAKAEWFSRVFDWTNNMGGAYGYADGWGGAARQYGWGPWPADWKRQRLLMPVASWWDMARSAIHLWFTVIMHSSDAQHVEAEMQDYFFRTYSRDVLVPVNDFMLAKYNQTIEQYQQSGGNAVSPSGSNTGLLVAAGVGLLAFVGNAK